MKSVGLMKCWVLLLLFEYNCVDAAEPEEAKAPDDFPYLIGFIKTEYGRRQFCMGALLTPIKILSAAHCFYVPRLSNCYKGTMYDSDLKHIYAVTGSGMQPEFQEPMAKKDERWDEKLVVRDIGQGRYPTKYEYPDNDIAVLFAKSAFPTGEVLAGEVVIKPTVNAISYEIDKDAECTIAVFKVEEAARSEPDVKLAKFVGLKLLTREACNILHAKDMSNFVCVQDVIDAKYLNRCTGGPMLCKKTNDLRDINGVLTGIVLANNVTSGLTHQKHFFTRVSSYAEFINSAPLVTSNIALTLISTLFMIVSC